MFGWLRRLGRTPEPAAPADPPARAASPAARKPTAPAPPPRQPSPTSAPAVKPPRPATPLERYGAGARPAPLLPACRVIIAPGHSRYGVWPVSPGKKRRDDARWMPPGRSVTVGGFEIRDGMVYVGTFLSAAPGGGMGHDVPAPCLINPALKVAGGRPQIRDDMRYWPSFSEITPAHRLTYLTWLSEGKRDSQFPVGYAFLYFYGLERRLLVDNPDPDEGALLVAEVERLRQIYSDNASFAGYSRHLLNAVELRRVGGGPGGLAAWRPDLLTINRAPMIVPPLSLKISLHAAHGVPLDADHAIAAMLAMPPFQGGPPSTIGMSRTRQVFIELARRRFEARFPRGYPLKVLRQAMAAFSYHAASQHLDIEFRIEGVGVLPDPTTFDWRALSELCASAAADLGPYAKLVGKDGSGAATMAAARALPPEIAYLGAAPAFRAWLEGLTQPIAEVPVKALAKWCLGPGREFSGPKPQREMSAMLSDLGWGFEPDPSCGGEKPGETVLVFRGGALPASFGGGALAACVLVSADPDANPSRIVADIARRIRLPEGAALRIAARCRTVCKRPLSPVRIKTLVGAIPEAERPSVAALAADVAAGGGEPSQAMLTALEKLHDLCGADRRALYTALHRGVAAAARPAAEPIVVERPGPRTGAFRLPPPPVSAQPVPAKEGVSLDMARVNAILRETEEVAAVLAPIYQDEDEPSAAPPPPAAPPEGSAAARFTGLAADPARLLLALSAQDIWPRDEFETLARTFGLMPDGALETINDWAFDTLDEALIEDGDPLTINLALLPGAPEEPA